MPDNLRVGIEVNVVPLSQLSTAAEQVAKSTTTAAGAFARLNEVTGGLPMRASEALAKLHALETQEKEVARASEEAARGMTSLDRAMATSAVRIAGAESGLGGLVGGFARVAGASESLAPVLAAAFPVIAGLDLIDMLQRGGEELHKWIRLSEETASKSEEWAMAITHVDDQMKLENDQLDNTIAKLEHKPENFLKIALDDNVMAADRLAKSLDQAMKAQIAFLEAGPGMMSSLILGKGNTAETGAMLEPLQRAYQLAIFSGDAEAQKNALLQEQVILRERLASEQAQRPVLTAQGAAGRNPDQDAIETYSALLKGVQHELAAMADAAEASQKRITKAHDEQNAETVALINKDEDFRASNVELTTKMAEQDLAEFQKVQKGKILLLESLAEEQKRLAEQSAKADVNFDKDVTKEATEQYLDGWREAIKQQSEEMRSSTMASERAMQDARLSTQSRSAGMGSMFGGAIQAQGIQAQLGVAMTAMNQAKESAATFNLELAALARSQSEVDTSTSTGATEYERLQTQIDAVRDRYDQASNSAAKFAEQIQQLEIQQKQLNMTLGQAMAQSVDQGFNSFNSGIIRMMTTGQSFTHTMQAAWTSMAESFIRDVLRMGERFAVAELMKVAVSHSANQAQVADTMAANLAKRLDDAKTAAAATMANVGMPLGLILAPLAFAATLSFAEGGIVPANLHAGEMVLPSRLSTFVQQSAASYGSGMKAPEGSPGNNTNRPITFQYHAHSHALDQNGIGDVLDAHGDKMFSYFQSKIRRMNL